MIRYMKKDLFTWPVNDITMYEAVLDLHSI